MKNKLLLGAALFCLATPSFATVHNITVADFSFTPTSLTISLGDTVNWVWSSGTHTTTSTTIPSGAASWDHSMTSSSTSFMYKPTVAGTYSYKCTPHASMGMTGSFTVTTPTGVQALTGSASFSIFPNPASGSLNLQFAHAGNVTVTISDLSGRQVFANTYLGQASADINVTSFAGGTYVVRVAQGSDVQTQEIVINH